jgi:hypothetical protein
VFCGCATGRGLFGSALRQSSIWPLVTKVTKTVFLGRKNNYCSADLGIDRDEECIASHEGLLIDAQGAKTRCVRLCSNGDTQNDLNRCTEVKVCGRKATGP